ncbi:MAG: hypothetical protein H0T76_08640 [Nannocystis sp.]|nr:hypothetical protein [Nannocystis sp.]MBA3546535.1 hypothetical protein [Nannocystis sp.]
MDLKTITATLALLGGTTTAGCGGETKTTTTTKTEVKTETKVEAKEVKPEVKPEVKEVTPATTETPAKGEMKCGEGKCGEGACGGKKNDGEVPAGIPVDAAKVKADDAAAKPVEKPADKT